MGDKALGLLRRFGELAVDPQSILHRQMSNSTPAADLRRRTRHKDDREVCASASCATSCSPCRSTPVRACSACANLSVLSLFLDDSLAQVALPPARVRRTSGHLLFRFGVADVVFALNKSRRPSDNLSFALAVAVYAAVYLIPTAVHCTAFSTSCSSDVVLSGTALPSDVFLSALVSFQTGISLSGAISSLWCWCALLPHPAPASSCVPVPRSFAVRGCTCGCPSALLDPDHTYPFVLPIDEHVDSVAVDAPAKVPAAYSQRYCFDAWMGHLTSRLRSSIARCQ